MCSSVLLHHILDPNLIFVYNYLNKRCDSALTLRDVSDLCMCVCVCTSTAEVLVCGSNLL